MNTHTASVVAFLRHQHYADLLRDNLPGRCHPYIDDALNGDVDAAGQLVSAAHNPERPLVVGALYKNKTAVPAVAEALAAVWNHDHHFLLGSFPKPFVKRLFQYAGTRPTSLPDEVTVWRGGRGTRTTVARGWSWTTDCATACWFACGWRAHDRNPKPPMVLKATVPAGLIVHTDDDREEHEMVLFGIREAVVDGTAADWQAEFEHEVGRRKANPYRHTKGAA